MKTWTPTDTSKAKYLGIFEHKDRSGDWHLFDLYETDTRIVFGGACNGGFLESGFIEKEEGETLADTLDEMFEDMDTYFHDGARYTTRITCNERMS